MRGDHCGLVLPLPVVDPEVEEVAPVDVLLLWCLRWCLRCFFVVPVLVVLFALPASVVLACPVAPVVEDWPFEAAAELVCASDKVEASATVASNEMNLFMTFSFCGKARDSGVFHVGVFENRCNRSGERLRNAY